MGLRDKLKRLERFADNTTASKDQEEARRRQAEEKRAQIRRHLEEVIATTSDEPRPALTPEGEAEIEEMWEATWGHLKRREE
jgi:predicted component of type VI protein secretion system